MVLYFTFSSSHTEIKAEDTIYNLEDRYILRKMTAAEKKKNGKNTRIREVNSKYTTENQQLGSVFQFKMKKRKD